MFVNNMRLLFHGIPVRERVLARKSHEIVLEKQTVTLRLSSAPASGQSEVIYLLFKTTSNENRELFTPKTKLKRTQRKHLTELMSAYCKLTELFSDKDSKNTAS